MLPLGRRVQDKLEGLIDKYMYQLGKANTLPPRFKAHKKKGASKLSLSSISSEDIWSRSGRLEKAGSEVFYFLSLEVKFTLSSS